jgi:transposase
VDGSFDRGHLEAAGVSVVHAYGSWGFRPDAIRRVDHIKIVAEASMPDKMFIGVDVSKDWLDIATYDRGEVQRIDNTTEAVVIWIATLAGKNVLIAFEPTGGYERILRASLLTGSLPFIRVHPNEVVAFRNRRGVK